MPAPRPTLTIAEACSVIGEAGFGPQPSQVGLELEWFVTRDGAPVDDLELVHRVLTADGPLPGLSRITFEPGGQLEISAPPSADGPSAVALAASDAARSPARMSISSARARIASASSSSGAALHAST